MASDNQNPTVFSTEFGRMCSKCGKPSNNCVCKKVENISPRKNADNIVRLFIDRKGRGGKSVTIIDGLPYSSEQLKDLAKSIKRQCGTGGAIKEGKIEIQGDVRDLILPMLQKLGLVVKKAGG
jgi:translation initiation factor 1